MAHGAGKLAFEGLADTTNFFILGPAFPKKINILIAHALCGLQSEVPKIREEANRFLTSDFKDFPGLWEGGAGLICDSIFKLTLIIYNEQITVAQYCKYYGGEVLRDKANTLDITQAAPFVPHLFDMELPELPPISDHSALVFNKPPPSTKESALEIDINNLLARYDHPGFLTHLFQEAIINSSLREFLEAHAHGSFSGREFFYATKILKEREKDKFASTAQPDLITRVLWPKISRIRLIYREDHNFSTAIALKKNIERLRALGYIGPIDILYYNSNHLNQFTREKIALAFPEPIANVTFICLDPATGNLIAHKLIDVPSHLNDHGYSSYEDIPYASITITHYTYGTLGAHSYHSTHFTGTQIDLNSNCPEFPFTYYLPSIIFADGRVTPLRPQHHDPLSYLPSELTLSKDKESTDKPPTYTWTDYLSQSDLPYDSMVARAFIGHLDFSLHKVMVQRLLTALLTRERPVILFSSENTTERGYFEAHGFLSSEIVLLKGIVPSPGFRAPEGAKVIIIELTTQKSEVFERMIELSTLPYLGMGSMTSLMRRGNIVLSARNLRRLPEHVMRLYEKIPDEYSQRIYQASLALSSTSASAAPLNDLLRDFNKDSAAVTTIVYKIKEELNSYPDQLCVALTYLSEHPEEILTEEQYKEAVKNALMETMTHEQYLMGDIFFEKKLRLLGLPSLIINYSTYKDEQAYTDLQKIKNAIEFFHFLRYFLCERETVSTAFHILFRAKLFEVAHKDLNVHDKAFLLFFIARYQINVSDIEKHDISIFLILSLMFLLDKRLLLARTNKLIDIFRRVINGNLNPIYYLTPDNFLQR